MQTIFKYNTPAFEFWNWINWIVITESDHNSWWNIWYNMKWRQWYDWNIIFDENLREKKINLKWYIKWTDAQDLLDKLNLLKRNLIKRSLFTSVLFPLLWQELPFLEIREWDKTIRYEWFFENLNELTVKNNWMINYLPINLNFICPNWYWNWVLRSFNQTLTSNFVSTTNIMFSTNESNTIVQPWIVLDFNWNYNWNITLQIWADIANFSIILVAWQKINISTVSNIIWIYLYNSDDSINKEIDFSWIIPRWIYAWINSDFKILFSTSVNVNFTTSFQERFI